MGYTRWDFMKQDVVKTPSQPVRLVDLIGYQDGSVVSRTTIEENTATVTLFAFAECQGLSEHTVPFDALVHVIDGEAEVILAAETFRLKTGEV
jgi:quercetin dioxygenase-like cupin family protein